jgi:hypothetical protein
LHVGLDIHGGVRRVGNAQRCLRQWAEILP